MNDDTNKLIKQLGKDVDKLGLYIYYIYIVIILLSTFFFFLINSHHNNKPSSVELHYAQFLMNKTIDGVYIPGCGIIFDTRNKSIDRIQEVVTHEASHYFLDHYENKTHFYGDVKE